MKGKSDHQNDFTLLTSSNRPQLVMTERIFLWSHRCYEYILDYLTNSTEKLLKVWHQPQCPRPNPSPGPSSTPGHVEAWTTWTSLYTDKLKLTQLGPQYTGTPLPSLHVLRLLHEARTVGKQGLTSYRNIFLQCHFFHYRPQ